MAENFFEFQERKGKERADLRRKKTDDPHTADGATALTVTQLSALIEKAIKTGVPASISVRGEVSNVSARQASGHLYFTLKDASACINCVMWRDAASRLRFKLEDGIEMIATGRVSLYAPQGRYQLVASTLNPVGRGALELAFQQLRAKLQAEGLFDPDRKREIPAYPARIVMITSRSTAALQDMLKVLRRYSWLKLMLYHVPVQGEGSGEKIARAIAHLNQRAAQAGGADVILLARGGGSLEDLWAFNEEVVARAVAASAIPIVTGIGHEVDVSIADLVADHHAHTPTEAAQVITQHWRLAAEQLQFSQTRLNRGLRQIIQDARQRLASIERHEIFRRPMERINLFRQMLDDRQRALVLGLSRKISIASRAVSTAEIRLQRNHPRHQIGLALQRLDSFSARLASAAAIRFTRERSRLDHLDRHLTAVSPQAVLKRGYTITIHKKTGKILRSAAELKEGDRIVTRFGDGQSESVVADSKQMSLFE